MPTPENSIERAPSAPKNAPVEVTEADKARNETKTNTAHDREALARNVETTQAEQKIESTKTGEASASRLDSALGGITGGINAVSNRVSPIFQRISAFFTKIKTSLSASLSPMLQPLKALGFKVPEWLTQAIPGSTELNTVLTEGGRTFVASAEDMVHLRTIIALHQRSANAAGGTYTLEQFMRECVVGLPGDKNAVSALDVRARAEVVTKQKEQDAEARRRAGIQTPPPQPAASTPPAETPAS